MDKAPPGKLSTKPLRGQNHLALANGLPLGLQVLGDWVLHSPGAGWVCDLAGEVLLANDPARAAASAGLPAWLPLPEGGWAGLVAELQGARQVVRLAVAPRPGGQLGPAEVSFGLVGSGDGQAVVVLVRELANQPGADEAAESLAQLADGNPNPVFRLQPDGKLLYSNRRNPELEKYLTDHLAEKFAPRMADLLAQNAAGEIEALVGNRFYSLSFTPIGPLGYFNIEAKDITDRKLAEEKIRASVNLYRLLSENSHDLICLHYPDGKLQYVSQAAKELLGYEPEELIGLSPTKLYHPQDVEVYRRMFERLRQDQITQTHQYRIGRKDGAYTWFETVTKPVFDAEGYIVRIQSASRDISERKQAEAEINTALSRLSALIQNMEAGILVEDEQRQVVLVNKRFADIFHLNLPVEQLLNKPSLAINDWVADWAENKAQFAERLASLVRRRAVSTGEEIVGRDGRILERDYVPIFVDGVYSGHLWEYKDVTERKQVEKELIKAKEDALQSMRAKEMFLSTMSHEIRTPMNAVIGMTHLLLQEDPKPAQVPNLQTLKFSAENLLVLINDILDFSKIEAGKISFEETTFNLRNFIGGIRSSFDFKAKEKGIAFKILLDSELPEFIVGDTVRLSQIIANLVGNAVKFTEQGRVLLDIVQEARDAESVVINFSVTDTGIGIAEEKIRDIFEQFTQASADTTRKYGGTGLGLAIVKRLLQMQGSQVQVESEPGKGSRFWFSLRFKLGAGQPPQPEPVAQANFMFAPLPGVRALLVEDNEINQMVATKFLNKWGVELDYAINGDFALEKIASQAYQIVLMDLQMPVKDGYETAQAIRQLEGDYFKSVPIVALTASAMSDVKAKVVAAGMDDYISKPFNPSDLYHKIARYTQSAHSQPVAVGARPQPLMATSALFNYSNVVNLALGDDNFRKELTTIYIRALRQLTEEYNQLILKKDSQGLVRLIHKMTPTIKTLETTRLEKELRQGVKLLTLRPKKDDLLHASEDIRAICQQIISELEMHLLGH
jgi:PAS domain S-box-containing protein